MLSAAPASAQTGSIGAFTERPRDALSRNLRSLAANPKSATALMGAGKAALELGDAQAALTFFARAEEQLPRDGRIKMWIGTALVHLQQPHAALKFFRDATDLGVPVAELARDRGLAHDVAGSPREAQRDYRLALQRGRDDEATRRLALSLAISGEREPALRLIEDQLLVRDRAAERTRALILALTGDTAGATRAAQAAMPGPQASAMSPFLARLPTLSPTGRALAVHLGIFPSDGRTAAPATYAANDFANAVTDAGRPDPAQTLLQRRQTPPEPASSAPRRRPGSEAPAATASVAPTPVGRNSRSGATASASVRPAPVRPTTTARSGGVNPAWALSRGLDPTPPARRAEPRQKAAEPAPQPTKPASETVIASVSPGFSIAAPQSQSAPTPVVETPVQPAPTPVVESPVQPEPRPAETQIAAAEPTVPPPAATQIAAADPPVPAPQSEGTPAGSRLADLSAAIATVDDPEAAPVKPKPAARAAAAAAKPPAKKAKPAPPAEPSRVWVQVAGGAQKAALPREFDRLKAKAPKLLGGRTAWTAPLNATNRLLVGPFPGSREAQAFVNQLKTADLSAFAWTSEAGQKIEKLPAK
ncbi:MAG TPA: SPOR domain-containing protein [Allosphingosinicella sp.]|jgi:Flp pilus assembly protein TadD